jgi:hypothetical protein
MDYGFFFYFLFLIQTQNSFIDSLTPIIKIMHAYNILNFENTRKYERRRNLSPGPRGPLVIIYIVFQNFFPYTPIVLINYATYIGLWPTF